MAETQPDEQPVVTRRDVADLEKAERWRYDQLVGLGFDREHAFTLALLRQDADLNKIRAWRAAGATPSFIYEMIA